MRREFSEEKRQEIFRLLDEIDNREWKSFMEWAGSRAEEYGDWPDKLNVSTYTRYVDAYHEKVLEINEMTRQQVNTVFENVAEIDARYAARMRKHREKIKEQIAIVKTMTEFMDSMANGNPNMALLSVPTVNENCVRTEDDDEEEENTEPVVIKFDEVINPTPVEERGPRVLAEYLREHGITDQNKIDRILEWIRRNDMELLAAFNEADIYGIYDGQNKEEIYVRIMGKFNADTAQEKILLSYLTEQGITIPEQQQGVLRLIWTERPDILETLYIMDCKGAEGMDDVLEAAMEHCYGAAEKVFIEYVSRNGVTDPAAHMIVLDRIRDTNPQLLLNLIDKNCDSDKEAEGLLEYYYSLQEGLTFSLERYDELRDLELADYHLNGTSEKPGGAGVYNDDGELIGIKPYYVLVNSQDGFKDDGGITFGIGHNISAKEWADESDREHQLLSGYIPEDVIITGIEVDDLPGCRLEIVPGSTMVPIEEVNRIFGEDIQEFSDKVANTLLNQGIDVTQNEFDALVICAYNRGDLSQEMLDYLKEGNREPEDWEDKWTGGDNRREYCQNLFFSGEN